MNTVSSARNDKPVLLHWLGSRIGVAVVAITIAYVVSVGMVRRIHYWDVIGYVASAYQADGYKGKELSEKTYADVRSEVSEAEFRTLTAGPYGSVVYKDPASLEQQVPFYSVRVVHVWLMRMVKSIGGSYALSGYIVTDVFSGLWIAALAVAMARSSVNLCYLPLLVAFIRPEVIGHGGASPDGMACFFALIVVLCCYSGSWWLYPAAVFLPLVRTDFVILSVLTILYRLFLTYRINVRDSASVGAASGKWRHVLRGEGLFAAAALAGAVGAYWGVNRAEGNYGWLTIVNFTFFDFNPYPRTMAISHHVIDYVHAYMNGISHLVADPHFPVYILSLCLIMSAYRNGARPSNYAYCFVMIPILFAAFHMALFPGYFERFFMFVMCTTVVALLSRLGGSPNDLSRHIVIPAGSDRS